MNSGINSFPNRDLNDQYHYARMSNVGCRISVSETDPIADATAATVLWVLPYKGKSINLLRNGINVPNEITKQPIYLGGLTASKCYDIFAVPTSKGAEFKIGPVWTNDTTRAAAVSFDYRVFGYTLTSDPSWHYVASVYIDAGGGAVTSQPNIRHMWNYYNRIPMAVDCYIGTRAATQYSTTSGSWVNVNGDSTIGSGLFSWIQGVQDQAISASWQIRYVYGVYSPYNNNYGLSINGATPVNYGYLITANTITVIYVPMSIGILYSGAAGRWTAQKQFQSASTTAAIVEYGIIGTFWG